MSELGDAIRRTKGKPLKDSLERTAQRQAATDLGMRWRGDWKPNVAYRLGDAVFHECGGFVAVRVHQGQEPPADRFWDVLVCKGEKGDKGDKGNSGIGMEGPPGPPGDPAEITVEDEGVVQGTATTFNFAGAGVVASMTGPDEALITIAGGSAGSEYPEDSPMQDGDIGNFVLAVRNDADAVTTDADGDFSQISVDSAGRIKVGNFPATQPVSVADGADVAEGATTDAAVITDAAGTISGKLRGLVKWAYERMPTSLGQKLMAASFPVVIASDQSAVSVDTELPAAAALADNTANPTVPGVGAFGMVWDGAVWDRMPGTSGEGVDIDVVRFPYQAVGTSDNWTDNTNTLTPTPGIPEPLSIWTRGYFFDGTNWDRIRGNSTDGLLVNLGANNDVSLNAGTNNIGDVDLASAIPTGTNEIGYVGARQVNGVIKDNDGTDSTVKVAHLDMTTATTTDIVAAVAGKRIRVLEYQVYVNEATATTVNFARGAGTTRCTGSNAMLMIAGDARTQNSRTAPTGTFLFETGDGEALRVTQTGATDISVAIVYIEVL